MKHLAYSLGVKLAFEEASIPIKRPHNREGTPKEDGIGFSTKQVSTKKEDRATPDYIGKIHDAVAEVAKKPLFPFNNSAKDLGNKALHTGDQLTGVSKIIEFHKDMVDRKKQSEELKELAAPEQEYVTKAREYADKYHKALLKRFQAEHEAKSQPSAS